MKVFHLPIEPYETRYTKEWIQQFEAEFKQADVSYETILGEQISNTIESGSVLDACGTHVYKSSQLIKLYEKIKAGQVTKDDVIFFSDLWFPGLESLFYIRNITKIAFKIAGIFHAGTWDPHDFTSRENMRSWGRYAEASWLHGIDIIFVATQWHKDMIVLNSEEFDEDKIFVTGLPFYASGLQTAYPVTKKENIVVFPHRLDTEKHPEKFDRLAKKYPQWSFVKTMLADLSRDEYFKMLARSKVMISYAEQETFGYSTLEAMALGNAVIVPDELSYRETVPKQYRYKKDRDVVGMLEEFMKLETIPTYPELVVWENSVSKMIRVLGVKMREAERRRRQFEVDERAEQMRIEEERKQKKQKRQEIQQAQEEE